MIRQRLRPLTPQLSGLVAACLLGAMGLIMLGSAWEDALTMDEPIHLTGVRYLLPVFPFTMILVGRTIGRWINPLPGTAARPTGQSLVRSTVVAVVLLWQVISVLRVYPSFLAYFHAAVGGPAREGGAAMSAIPTWIGGKIYGGCGRLSTRTTRCRSRWTTLAAAR
jgi:hypothetical protein